MESASASESLWAEHGLTGMVLFSLFGLIILFIRVNTKKDTSHQQFIEKLLGSERDERKETRKENSENAEKLSIAIANLTEELKARPKRFRREEDSRREENLSTIN